MLPDIHSDTIKDNRTGMVGVISNRSLDFVDNHGGDFRIVRGCLNSVEVVEVHTVDVFGGGSQLETVTQYNARTKQFDELCKSLV